MYRTLPELPLKNWIDCTVDGNLYALVKSSTGEVPLDELKYLLLDLEEQYAESIGDSESKLFLSLYRDIHVLNLQYNQAQHLISILEKFYVKEFAKLLNKLLKNNLPFDVTNKELYDKNLKKCASQSKAFKLQIDLKTAQFESIQKKFSGEKPSREYYTHLLVALSNHAGYQLRDDISVYEFCHRMTQLKKQK